MLASFRPAARLGAVLLFGLARGAAAQQPLTLDRAIELAQQQSNQAEVARASREAARARDRGFYSRLLPQLGLAGSLPQYNRSIIPVVQPDGSTLFRSLDQTSADLTATVTQRLPLIGGDLLLSSSLSRFSVGGDLPFKSWSSTPFSIGIRQPLFRPNGLAWDRREQPVRTELAERTYREAKELIAIQTTGLFFDAFAAQVSLRNATTNVAVNDTLYLLNKGRLEVGKIGENDLLQSELAQLRSRATQDGARLDYDRAIAALRLTLNLPPTAPLEITIGSVVPAFDADTAKAVLQALANRAGSSESDLALVQADRAINAAKLNNGIGATINASYGYNATATDVNLAYRNLLEARQFSVSVDVPLLQWGTRKNDVEAAVADRKRAVATARTNRDQAAQDAYFAALQLAQSRRNLAISAKADTVAGKRFEVAYNRYSIGKIQLDNLFIAQSEKDQALTQYVLALRGYWFAYYRLRLLTLYDFAADRPIE